MDRFLVVGGNAAAIVGVALCIVSAAIRLLGVYSIGSLGAGQLFLAGVGAMVFACLVKLHALSQQSGG